MRGIMLKKIETFLAIILAICAVLLLLANSGRSGRPAAAETTASAVQTTAPETEPQTLPETTAPEETTPATEPPAGTVPASQARSRVEQLLEGAALEQTAATRLATEPGLHAAEGTSGLASQSHGAALAALLQDRPANPVAAFWELVSGGLYEKKTEDTGTLSLTGFRTPEQAAKRYDYTSEGARQLLTELLALAARMEDGLDLEQSLLGANLSVEGDQVFWSEAEKCRYAYFSCTSERATYILCFYLRGEQQIEDVEFQLLYLRHADGGAEALAALDHKAKKQTASLMAAAELLMTGKTRAGEGEIPFSYEIGGAEARLERFTFTGDPDRGSLTNYRLKK